MYVLILNFIMLNKYVFFRVIFLYFVYVELVGLDFEWLDLI